MPSLPAFNPSRSPRREQFALIPFSILVALAGTVTRSGILVYCALAAHADPSGHCWPGRSRLAEITGLSERQISRATAELVSKGLLRKTYRSNGGVDYFLLPVTPVTPVTPAANQTPPPDTAVTPPLTTVAPRTDQGSDQKEQREPEPDPPPPPEPATELPPIGAHTESATQPAKAKVVPLPSKTTLPEDWELPPDYRDWAEQRRPDLADRLDAIAETFKDYHASKGTRSASWIAEWRIWINRERPTRQPPQGGNCRPSTPPVAVNRYAHFDMPETPVAKAVREAHERRSEEARIAMLVGLGIDPATGLRIEQPTPPAPPAARDTDRDRIEAEFEKKRRERIAALERRIAEKGGKV